MSFEKKSIEKYIRQHRQHRQVKLEISNGVFRFTYSHLFEKFNKKFTEEKIINKKG